MRILQTLGMDVLSGTGSPIRTLEISGNLSRKGHRVEVTSFSSRGRESQGRNGLRISRIPFPRARTEELRYLLGRRSLSKLNRKVVREAGIEIVHSHLFLAASSVRRLGLPFVYDMHSLFPEERLSEGGLLTRARLLPFRPIEERLRRECSSIVATSDTMRDFLRARGYPRVESVPVGVNTELFRPRRPSREIARELGIEGKKVVMYTGNTNLYQGMEDVVRAASLVRDREVSFVIVGGGPELGGYRRMASSLGARNIIFTGPQPYPRMPEFLSVADVCLSMRTSSFSGNMTFPTKLTTYMAAGRPSVCTRTGDQETILERDDVGWLVDPGKPESLARTLEEALSDTGALKRKGRRAREASLERYSWDVLTRIYEKEFSRALG